MPTPDCAAQLFTAALTLLVATGCATGHGGSAFSSAPSLQRTAPDFLDHQAPKAQLLMLGVFHFADQGLDEYKPKFSLNVLSPTRQHEIADVAQRLVRFAPTRVAVEWPAQDQPRLDSLYQAYVRGDYTLGANEVYQLGFRAARQLGLDRIYAIDVDGRASFTEDQARAEAAALGVNIDSVLKADPWKIRYQRLYEYGDSLKTVSTLREYLLYLNDPERIRIGHGAYLVGGFKLDKGNDYIGVDDATQWYNRNLRIFNNLQRLTGSPSERVLLVIGSGHLPILRFLAQSSPEHRLIEASDYLGAPRR